MKNASLETTLAKLSYLLGYTVSVSKFRLSLYLVREVGVLYAIGVPAFCLLLFIDFLTVWASFLIEYEATVARIGRLMLFQMPFFLHLTLPIAVVFAVLLATGRLAKDSELKAAYALGVPPLSLLWPLLVFGLLISGLVVYNNGFLEPRGKVAYDREVASFFYTRPPSEAQNDVSYVLPGGIHYAGRVNVGAENRNEADLAGVLVVEADNSLLTAQRGVWDSGERLWTLYDAVRIAPRGAPEYVGEVVLPFDTASSASESLANPQTQTLAQLWARYVEARRTGGNTRQIAFEFHRRIADALSTLVFVLIAGALGLHLRGRAAGFGWTIVLLVLFYFLWTLSGDLFERQVLTPVMAAYFTSAVVGMIGFGIALVRLR